MRAYSDYTTNRSQITKRGLIRGWQIHITNVGSMMVVFESPGVCTYVREANTQRDVPRWLLAVNTDDAEKLHVDLGRIDSETSSSQATRARIIWSFQRERRASTRRQAPSHHRTPLSGVQFWYPLHIALQLDLRITSLPENSPKTRDECR